MLRKLGSTVVAAAMVLSATTAAFAGTESQASQQKTQQGPLAPGGTAGLHQAQMLEGNGLYLVIGLGVVAGGLCAALCSNGNGTPSTTTTGAP